VRLTIYHKTSRDSVPSILADGLKPGAAVGDEATQAANAYLDARCSRRFAAGQVRRTGSIYCYLCVDGNVFDVDSGRLVDRRRWSIGEDEVTLLVRRTPEPTFVSDLDAFDALRARLDDGAPDDELRTLARRYWDRLVPLAELARDYRLVRESLVRLPTAPPGPPARLERAELLVAAEIAPEHIRLA
jgi:hypothetical protein